MDDELAAFLAPRTPDFEQLFVVGRGEHRMQLRGYFTVPLSHVRAVELDRFLFWRLVVVRFVDEAGRARSIALRLQNPDELVRLLQPNAPAAAA